VLAPNVRFEGFTATDWQRFLSLFRPRRASGAPRDPERPQGGVVAVHTEGRLWKLVHTEVGRLRLDDTQRDWPMSAEELAIRNHASWAARLEAGALEAIMERFGARARPGDDLITQVLALIQLARDELATGRIDVWPLRLRGLPMPSPAMVRRSLDSVCPVGRVLVLGFFEGGELWTSIALRRTEAGVDLVLGPDEIRAEMGLLSADWRRDYRHLARAIEDRAGPIAMGCYADVSTVRSLAVDPTPGAWARAVAVRDVILSPLPAPIAIPLGIDVGRAAWGAARRIAERVDPVGVVGPTLELALRFGEPALRKLGVVAPEDEPGAIKFEPLEVLRRLLSRER
jgi:hypothetical protein